MSPGVTGAGTTGVPATVTVPATAAAWTALAAGAAVVLLSFLPWLSISRGGTSFSRTAWKVPAAFLVDRDADPDGIKLALLLLVIGAVTAGLALFAPTSTVAWWAGVPMVAITLLYIVQVTRVPGLGPGDVGFGAWLTGATGVACLVIPVLERAATHEYCNVGDVAGNGDRAGRDPVAAIASTGDAHANPGCDAGIGHPGLGADPPGPSLGRPLLRASGSRLADRRRSSILASSIAVTEETMGWAHITCSNGWTTWIDGRPARAAGLTTARRSTRRASRLERPPGALPETIRRPLVRHRPSAQRAEASRGVRPAAAVEICRLLGDDHRIGSGEWISPNCRTSSSGPTATATATRGVSDGGVARRGDR